VIVISHNRLKLTFKRPFSVRGINRLLPAGNYELVPDHELTSEYYIPAYRQVVTLLSVPSEAYRRSSIVKTNVATADILASHKRDIAATVKN
jgi:hypothetical protein